MKFTFSILTCIILLTSCYDSFKEEQELKEEFYCSCEIRKCLLCGIAIEESYIYDSEADAATKCAIREDDISDEQGPWQSVDCYLLRADEL